MRTAALITPPPASQRPIRTIQQPRPGTGTGVIRAQDVHHSGIIEARRRRASAASALATHPAPGRGQAAPCGARRQFSLYEIDDPEHGVDNWVQGSAGIGVAPTTGVGAQISVIEGFDFAISAFGNGVCTIIVLLYGHPKPECSGYLPGLTTVNITASGLARAASTGGGAGGR